MAFLKNNGAKIVAIGTCVPSHRFDDLADTTEFTPAEVRKVVAMAGIQARRVADESVWRNYRDIHK
jgi:hypothetical protein